MKRPARSEVELTIYRTLARNRIGRAAHFEGAF